MHSFEMRIEDNELFADLCEDEKDNPKLFLSVGDDIDIGNIYIDMSNIKNSETFNEGN